MLDSIVVSLKAGGWMLLPIFLVSVWAWMLVVRIFFRIRKMDLGWWTMRTWAKSPNHIDVWIQNNPRKNASETIVGQLLIRINQLPESATRQQVENTAEEVIRWMVPESERELSLLGALAGIAPLLGLLGTVQGMIGTFNLIGSFGTSNPAFMADSISVALITTQDALVVAVPLLLAHSFLKNRRRKMEDKALELLQVYSQYKFSPMENHS